MDEQQLLVASQVAEMLGGKNNGWSRQRVHVELKRGTFPKAKTYAGKQPLWTRDQIETYKRERGIE